MKPTFNMNSIFINRFDGGMANDIYSAAIGQFSVSKQFDILTYSNRLTPLRGMTSDTTGTGVGNIIVESSTGLFYGVGTDPIAPANGALYRRSGYGFSDTWGLITPNSQGASVAVLYPFLVDWRNSGNVRTLYWAGANTLIASDPAGASSAATQSLTFTSIGQGFVHPADQILYIPYNTSSSCLIAALTTNASVFGSFNATALTLPKQYQVYTLCSYGNYLAIPATTTNPSSVSSSRVFFWGRDITQSWDYDISWGGGDLKVLNNLNGILIGVSSNSGNGASGAVQDRASISIKAYAGGEVESLFEIAANHLSAASFPSVVINPNVNFIKNNRLYFSVNIIPNDGVSSNYYGLWSIGKNAKGRYIVTIERIATNDNSETGVLAAAIAGDFVSMVHTSVGTITSTINGQTSASTYGATSIYESVVNPDMPQADLHRDKKLVGVAVHMVPITSGAQVVMKVRVDQTGIANWKPAFTKTITSPDTSLVVYETTINAAMNIPDGRNFEFRLESTGGAQIVGYTYTYRNKNS